MEDIQQNNSMVEIRELNTDDYEELSLFNAQFPGDKRTKEDWLNRFQHWWDNNPAFDDKWIRGFLLIADGKIVGWVGSFPTWFKAGENIVKAFNGTSWRVLEPFRKYSIDLWTKNREISKHFISFNTTPTEDVIKMITRLGYVKYPWGGNRESYYLLKPYKYIQEILPQTWHRLLPLMGTFIILYQKAKIRLVKSNLTLKLLDINADEINELWNRNKNRIEFTNVRDSLAIQWYAENKLLLGVFLGEKLTAIAILDLRKNLKYDSFELTFVDCWVDYEISIMSVLSAIVRFCIKYAKENDVSRLRFPHFSPEYSNTLKKIGLLTKKYDHPGYIRIPDYLKKSFTNESSYFTLLQGDYGV
jgi:hypothetical protein